MTNLKQFTVQTAEPQAHFAAIAALISSQETEPTTASSMLEWYNRQLHDGIWLHAAVDENGELAGFNGLYRLNLNLEANYGMYLIVAPHQRRQGLGELLYQHLLQKAQQVGARTLTCRVRDTCEEGLSFARGRGFDEKYHSIEMWLDLVTLDLGKTEPILDGLRRQGFQFTNMAELGDTESARRKLYALNSSTAATDVDANGIPPWASFEEFERDVCQSSWYHPDGQIVAIDTASREWAAMSAITVFEGADHAYNLFTGTDVRYRGRRLAQAVKSLALKRARQFGVQGVRTSHDARNTAMIAIDTKLGYQFTPGTYVMEKKVFNV